MRTLRIFISSPGDVTKERERAREVVESLRRRFARHFLLQAVLWEDLPLQSDMSFQRGIDAVLSEKGVDIAIFILWSRLGTPLGPAIPRPDGTPYLSGTEREFDLIMQARAASLEKEGTARPAVLVYTRRDDASFEEALRGTSTEKKEELIEQKKRVESFLAETFRDKETGVNIGAYFPFDRPVTFSQRLRTHLQGLLDEIAGESTEVVWDIDKQGPPFLGLEAFQPEHAAVFFGREEEILEARHALKEQAREGCAFLLLSGASGSGKSSLARAGVLPAIVELEVDEQVAAWSSLVLTPSQLGPDPITALVVHLADEQHLPSLVERLSSLPDLVAGLKKDPDLTFNLRLKEAFAKSGAKHGGSVRLLLVLDQLEEFFTTAALSAEDRAVFFAVIETFARSGSVWVLATVRSDFYEQIQNEPVLVRMKSGHGQLDVLPPGPDALTRLIEEPARLAGLTFERRDDQILSSRIIKDAAAHAELLPLVEFVLRELFERRSDNHLLTFDAYEALGGVEGALAKRAEDTFSALPVEAQDSLNDILPLLISVDTAGEQNAVRRRAPLSELSATPARRQLTEALITARFLTTGQQDGTAVASLAHEALLRRWDRLKEWTDRNRDLLRLRATVEQSERRWCAGDRDRSLLLSPGLPLEEGRRLLRDGWHLLGGATREYVEVSIAQQDADEARQEAEETLRVKFRRGVIASLSVLTVAALCAASWALVKQAAETRARQKRDEMLNFVLNDLRANLEKTGTLDSVQFALEKLGDTVKASSKSEQLQIAESVSIETARIFFLNNKRSEALQLLEVTIESFEGKRYPRLSDDQLNRMVHARALAVAGDLYGWDRTRLDDAELLSQSAIEIYESLLSEDSRFRDEITISLGAALVSLGDTAREKGDYERALFQFERCRRLLEKLPPDNDSMGRDGLLAKAFRLSGEIHYIENRFSEANSFFRESLAMIEAVWAKDNNDNIWTESRAISLNRLGDSLEKLERPQEAAEAWFQSYRLLEALSSKDLDNSLWKWEFSVALRRYGRTLPAEESRPLLERSLMLNESLVEIDAQNSDWRSGIGTCLLQLAEIEPDAKRAVELLNRSIEYVDQSATEIESRGRKLLRLIMIAKTQEPGKEHVNIGALEVERADASNLLEQHPHEDTGDFVRFVNLLSEAIADAYFQEKNLGKAIPEMEAVVDYLEKSDVSLKRNLIDVVNALQKLATFYRSSGSSSDFEKAHGCYNEALKFIGTHAGENGLTDSFSVLRGDIALRMAGCFEDQGNIESAIVACDEAVKWLSAALKVDETEGRGRPYCLRAQANASSKKAGLLKGRGDVEAALESYETSVGYYFDYLFSLDAPTTVDLALLRDKLSERLLNVAAELQLPLADQFHLRLSIAAELERLAKSKSVQVSLCLAAASAYSDAVQFGIDASVDHHSRTAAAFMKAETFLAAAKAEAEAERISDSGGIAEGRNVDMENQKKEIEGIATALSDLNQRISAKVE